ncbi:MAG: toxic anion resistance protein [Candidatus Saccharimonadales bacterium]
MSDFELVLETGTAAKPTELAVIEKEAANLTPEEHQKIKDFAAKINIHDTTTISRYGESSQNKSSQFSDSALKGVKAKDLDTVGDMISGLVVQIRGFRPTEEKKGLARLFQKGKNIVAELQAQYADVSANVDKICDDLKGHRFTLLADVTMLDSLFESNLQYFKELTMYILAGKQKLEEVRTGELEEMRQKAALSGSQEDAQRASDLEQQCDRFEKRIYDLQLTRTICIQMAPQIRMVQNTNVIMADKIQTSIANTIPLWKNQMLLALGMQHTRRAIEAQREVTNVTNELLNETATLLKQNTIAAAQESERGIVDIETLVKTNESIISTLDEVLVIQQEGRQKRIAAEQQLIEIENQLKVRLTTPRTV